MKTNKPCNAEVKGWYYDWIFWPTYYINSPEKCTYLCVCVSYTRTHVYMHLVCIVLNVVPSRSPHAAIKLQHLCVCSDAGWLKVQHSE